MQITRTHYRHSDAVRFVINAITAQFGAGEEQGYDVKGIVDELYILAGSYNFAVLVGPEFWPVVARHQLPADVPVESEPTDEELIAAISRCRTGWGVLVRKDGVTDMFEVRNPNLTSEDEVRAHLTGLFGPDVAFQVFPQIG